MEIGDGTYKEGLEKTGFSHKVGGLFIAVGGIILYSQIGDDCSQDLSVESCLDRLKSQAKIGYGLIIIGGFFIALGN